MHETHLKLKPFMFITAADLITRRGWTQRDYRDRRGFCALGALSYVYTNGEYVDEIYGGDDTTAARALGTRNVAYWNDHPETTKTEVVTRLRAASHIMAHGNEAPVLAEWVGDA